MDGINSGQINNLNVNRIHPENSKNLPAPENTAKDPQDKITIGGNWEFNKSDLQPSGKLGIIIESPDPKKLAQLKENILSNPNNKITADLPLINGFAAEVDPHSDGILSGPDLGQSVNNVRIFLDGQMRAIEPVEKSDEVHAMMDVAGKAMGLDKVWAKGYMGQGMKLCVIDTGIAKHKDLEGRVLDFKDWINNQNGPENHYDDNNHGTHCAGISAGNGAASEGKFKGAAPEAGILGAKVLNKNGGGSFSNIISALQWAGEKNVDVVTLSLGGTSTQSYKDDPVVQAVEALVSKGIAVFVAAGNSGPSAETISTPAIAPHVVTVGALDDRGTVERDDDTVASFSSCGPTEIDKLPKPDVITPGVRITAPLASGGYTSMSGTSMATPLAAGMALLIKQACPTITPGELKGVIMGTADFLNGKTHNQQGAGAFNLAKAIEKLTGEKFD